MALLDQVLGYVTQQSQVSAPTQTAAPQGSAQSGVSSLSPLAKSVMLVLAAKAWQSYSANRASRGEAASPQGGVGSFGAGGLLGGLAGLVAGLGGAGALGGLMGRFEQSGLGDQARSWVGSGANEPIAADEVETALGGQTLDELARRLQIPVETLKSELAAVLPQAVDQLTPRGELPSDADLRNL